MEKQRKFITLVKEVQNIFNSKEYQKQGYSFKQFTRMKWDISQAQAYRYIMCAKVIDQLDEFEIKPSYESLCKSMYNVATTPIQMKLLWSKILQKTNNRPDCINSTHVNQYWKELCMDKKYSNICKYKDQNDIMEKIERSLNKFSNEKKHKQINQKKIDKNQANQKEQTKQNINNINVKTKEKAKVSSIPSPAQSESSTTINYISTVKEPILYSNDNANHIFKALPVSSLNNCPLLISNNENILKAVPSQNEPTPLVSNCEISLSPLSLSSLNQFPPSIPSQENSISPQSATLSNTTLPPSLSNISNSINGPSIPQYLPCTVSSPQAIYYIPIQNEYVYSYQQQPLTQIAYIQEPSTTQPQQLPQQTQPLSQLPSESQPQPISQPQQSSYYYY
jgi:hypothetical protein